MNLLDYPRALNISELVNQAIWLDIRDVLRAGLYLGLFQLGVFRGLLREKTHFRDIRDRRLFFVHSGYILIHLDLRISRIVVRASQTELVKILESVGRMLGVFGFVFSAWKPRWLILILLMIISSADRWLSCLEVGMGVFGFVCGALQTLHSFVRTSV